MRKLNKVIIITSCATLLTTCAWAANAPVEDLNQDNAAQPPAADVYNTSSPDQPSAIRQDLPTDERVRLLEQQLSNLVQMNLPGKIDNLQQQIQQLNGQIEVQNHNIQQLTDQVNKFYQDLDQRITKQAPGNSNTAKTSDPDQANISAPATTASQIAQAEANVTNNTAPPVPAKTSAATAQATAEVNKAASEADAYQVAFNLLTAKKNTQAIGAFQAFLKKYPKGTFAANAYFWLGQLYSNTDKPELAAQQFTTLITQFPDSSKVADAKLKLAIIHDDAGKHTQAQSELQQIIKQYPDSSAARLAKIRLQQMNTPKDSNSAAEITASPA